MNDPDLTAAFKGLAAVCVRLPRWMSDLQVLRFVTTSVGQMRPGDDDTEMQNYADGFRHGLETAIEILKERHA